MSINVKKYTKDQMAKMVEDSQAEVQELRRVNAALTEQIDQMMGLLTPSLSLGRARPSTLSPKASAALRAVSR